MNLARIARIALLCLAPAFAVGSAQAQEVSYDREAASAAREAFIETMVSEHGFEREDVAATLAQASISQTVLQAISRPAERVVPWYEYREIFVTPERIEAGAQFWRDNAAAIAQMSERFGVDPEIIVSIIGIETYFGRIMGNYRVIDALSTLAFAYPPRAAFFSSELESFFLLTREESVSPVEALGSYAGAMGAGQFIPSSFRAYAVDGDDDGRRDLWGNWNDVLASVANYLSEHGWRANEPVVEPAERPANFAHADPTNGLDLTETAEELAAKGYEFSSAMDGAAPAAVYALERDAASMEYWVAYHNFRVITRYNRSAKYALAAFQLGQAIRQEYESIEVASR